jgi:2-keto-4-pentenoate hydratase
VSATIDAAELLWSHWQRCSQIDGLPPACRPNSRAEGYAIQAEVAKLSGHAVAGWKIAATSVAGQKHIKVDGPLAGRLLAHTQKRPGGRVPLAGNVMNVAEGEFAFRMAGDLPSRSTPYSVDDVLSAVGALHLAIEVPNSRYREFAKVGTAQLIADTACACWFLLGPESDASWRDTDLSQHGVVAYRNGQVAGEGSGANVLGDPRVALAWIANELCTFADGLRAGEVVMTGTCLVPVAVAPGDHVRMDFGRLGSIETAFG